MIYHLGVIILLLGCTLGKEVDKNVGYMPCSPAKHCNDNFHCCNPYWCCPDTTYCCYARGLQCCKKKPPGSTPGFEIIPPVRSNIKKTEMEDLLNMKYHY
uniref:Cysteine rich secreted protein n=1 Tax=Riptortus pedestris TaxID=329032 RepID=R4WQX3_RIPPE|nr:cysteine rich secreted protein [Riptortus pedestris]